jgi:hypothetical protein
VVPAPWELAPPDPVPPPEPVRAPSRASWRIAVAIDDEQALPVDTSLADVALRSRKSGPGAPPGVAPPSAPEQPAAPTPIAQLMFGSAPRQQYPIPPVADGEPDAPAPPVPSWGVRAPDASLPEPAPRPAFSVRRGLSKLTLDDRELRARSALRRARVPWEQISGFVPRFEQTRPGSDARGVLVALTYDGELVLTATRARIDRLRELHEILDAHHMRWRSTPRP